MTAPPNNAPHAQPLPAGEWHPESWKQRLASHQVVYEDRAAVDRAVAKLRTLPPLVTSGEIERLRGEIAEAQEGKRFVLQGGDCAETLADCTSTIITNKLKILLQMSLVLVHGLRRPVVRIGRIAGQYAKPRSSPVESRGAITLPSYFGDLVNEADFTPEARRPDPHRMVRGYQHAAMTLNFIRSLLDGGFADLHHPEYWNLGFISRVSPPLRDEYERMTSRLAESLRIMEILGERPVDELSSVEFFTSHEGLNLLYESAQTRRVPRRDGWFDLTTHMPWIGERTRALDGAHIEFFRGIRNPIGVKIGPKCTPGEVVALTGALNPDNEPGRLTLIHRMGRKDVERALPPILRAVADSGARVLWMCDPMHGNPAVTSHGIKTRNFDDILGEFERAVAAHRAQGTILGGVHFELTGDDVAECIGGSTGIGEHDLSGNYSSPCDPRLNHQQALEMAFLIARTLGR